MKSGLPQLLTITTVMVGVTLRGWRAGDAKRDVALMAVITAALAGGSLLLAVW